jgi:phage shock protein A
MSGVMKRMKLIVEAKANKALERNENPAEMLDLSYEKQLELLTRVKRGVVEVSAARHRLTMQMNRLQEDSQKRELQARKALEVGREDLAREALRRRAEVQQQITDLEPQYTSLRSQEEQLVRASQTLQARVDAFRVKKETIKATYHAAEATTRIGEAFAGLSEEMGDVNLAIERAEQRTQELQARGAALGELEAAGVLPDVTGLGRDSLTADWTPCRPGRAWTPSWRGCGTRSPPGPRPGSWRPAAGPRTEALRVGAPA